MRCLIVANGPEPESTFLTEAVEKADLIIAVDGGADVLRKAEVEFDLLVGDLDSANFSDWKEDNPRKLLGKKIVEYPRDKDETDCELAVAEAIKRGADKILMMGVVGKRIDHTLTNVSLMARYPDRIRIHSNDGPVRIVKPDYPLRMELRPGTLVSLSAWQGDCEGITTEGLMYELVDDVLEMSGRGVENVAEEDIAVSVKKGNLVVTVISEERNLVWEDRVRGGFDFGSIAKTYDSFYNNPLGKVIDEAEKAAVSELLPRAKGFQPLIEIGSGTGHWSEWFAELGYNVTGIDIATEMIEEANRKRKERNIENVRYAEGNAEHLGFPDDFFDVGVAITLLEFVDDPIDVINELARVVHRGGRLIFGVLHEDSFLGRIRKTEPDPIYTPAHFFTEDEIREILKPLGEVRIRQCVFFDPVPGIIDKAMEIEEKGKSEGWTNGNFLVAEVKL